MSFKFSLPCQSFLFSLDNNHLCRRQDILDKSPPPSYMHSPQFGSLSVSRSVPPCHLLMSSGMYGLRFYSKCTSRPKHLSVGDHIPHQRLKLQDGKTEKWRKVNFLDRNLTTRATALATPRIIGSNRRFFLFLVLFG